MKELDFLFIQLYIRKKYNINMETYFGAANQTVADWRKINKLPKKRLDYFLNKEGTIDVEELFFRLYKN